jgi:nitrogen regulatory protein PII
VMEGKLRRFGAGSIFALPCEELVCSEDFPLMLPGRYSFKSETFDIQFKSAFAELVHITDRGAGEPIARAAIKAGAQGATFTYVRGYGLRDRLGLLRITKSHDKELVVVVVDEYDRDAVFEAMAMAGQVDQPGRGLVYQLPLGKGIANLSSVFHARKHSASIQQMVRAIDELQGNTDWRANQLLVHDPKAEAFADKSQCLSRDLKLLKIILRRKDVEVLLGALLDHGIAGASVSTLRCAEAEREESLGKARLHREFGSISLVLPPSELAGLCETVRQTVIEHEMPETCYFVNTVPQMRTFAILGD